jgi:NADH:ubiquinone oxidoreductase subunit E/Pyruvate/2-oxoacid:ferredoxin oxidoreductase delta subunit/ferredoxin
METIRLEIDGKGVSAEKGKTILEVAKGVGIEIPTLCHKEELSSFGGCRLCVVEVEGRSQLVGSCHTPIEEGMVIRTRSAKVMASRKGTMELLFAGHTGPCVTDRRVEECELHNLAAAIELGPPRFRVKAPRFHRLEDVSLYVWRDMSKCILCGRCVRACREIAGQEVYSTAYRGFRSKVVVDFDEPLNKEVCKDCGICVEYCPTTALQWAEGREGISGEGKGKPAPMGRSREKLLGMLEGEQRKRGFVSRGAMVEMGGKLGMPLSEVYGVATFYAFISVVPEARNVIRICKSLPCYMRDGRMIIESIEKELGIGPGGSTGDGKFSFELTNCIGACDQAPAMLVNDDVHGNLTPERISGILKSYQ